MGQHVRHYNNYWTYNQYHTSISIGALHRKNSQGYSPDLVIAFLQDYLGCLYWVKLNENHVFLLNYVIDSKFQEIFHNLLEGNLIFPSWKTHSSAFYSIYLRTIPFPYILLMTFAQSRDGRYKHVYKKMHFTHIALSCPVFSVSFRSSIARADRAISTVTLSNGQFKSSL